MRSKIISILIITILIAVIFAEFVPAKAYLSKSRGDVLPVSYMSDAFPSSYQPYINALKALHPNWIFKAVYTNLDWNSSVVQESYLGPDSNNMGISTVDTRSGIIDSYWKKDGINYAQDGPFVTASKEAVAYTLDPRNFLTEAGIFQFASLSFSNNIDTLDAVNKVLDSTNMGSSSQYSTQYKNNGVWTNMGKSYAQLILDLSKKYNVSAVYIASLIVQETGGDICNDGSINGSLPGYTGYYNFFNIEATPPDSVTNGLIYAKSQGWSTPAASIEGGIAFVTSQYIKYGQDTSYFQKFDVNNPYGNAGHLYYVQYMTNIQAPSSQANSTYNAYKASGSLNNIYEFHIPVYENMPVYPASYPYGYSSDSTKVSTYNVTSSLSVRTNPNTTAYSIAGLSATGTATRIQTGTSLPWDRVVLSDGRAGYVSNAYIVPVPTTHVSSVSLSPTSITLKAGQTQKLTFTISPSNASIKDIAWSSSNNSIASVDSSRHCNG